MRKEILEVIQTYIVVHGWTLKNEKIAELINGQIRTFQAQLYKVEKIIGQGVWSSDWILDLAPPGSVFDPSFMEDGDNVAARPQEQLEIAFSTLLGLRNFNADTKQSSVVIKTKVQLVKTIHTVLTNGPQIS